MLLNHFNHFSFEKPVLWWSPPHIFITYWNVQIHRNESLEGKYPPKSKLVKFTLHGLCIKQYFCSKDPFLSWYWIWFLKIICPFFPSTHQNLENMIPNPHLGQEFWYKNLSFVYIKTVISKTSFAIMRSLLRAQKIPGRWERDSVCSDSSLQIHQNHKKKKNLLFKTKIPELSQPSDLQWWAQESEGPASTKEVLETSWSYRQLLRGGTSLVQIFTSVNLVQCHREGSSFTWSGERLGIRIFSLL